MKWDEVWVNNNIGLDSTISEVVEIILEAIKEAVQNGQSNESFLNLIERKAIAKKQTDSGNIACEWAINYVKTLRSILATGGNSNHNGSRQTKQNGGTIETMNVNPKGESKYKPFYDKHKVYEFVNSGL